MSRTPTVAAPATADPTARARWWTRPEVRTVGFVAFIATFGTVLYLVTKANARDTSYFASLGFQIWLATVTLSSGLWVALLTYGVKQLRRLGISTARLTVAIGCYLAVAVATSAVLKLAEPQNGQGPIRHFGDLITVLLFLGGLAGAPWVIAVWRAHQQVHDLDTGLRDVTAAARERDAARLDPTPSQASAPDATPAAERSLATSVRSTMEALESIWQTTERCVIALVLLVMTAVFNTGALRAALTAKLVPEKDFPVAAVLVYGAFFAAVLASAVLPLVTAWRAKATALVGAAIPFPTDRLPDEQWAADRARLQALLHLDTSVLRSPLVGLTVLAPLLSALIAAYVPGAES